MMTGWAGETAGCIYITFPPAGDLPQTSNNKNSHNLQPHHGAMKNNMESPLHSQFEEVDAGISP